VKSAGRVLFLKLPSRFRRCREYFSGLRSVPPFGHLTLPHVSNRRIAAWELPVVSAGACISYSVSQEYSDPTRAIRAAQIAFLTEIMPGAYRTNYYRLNRPLYTRELGLLDGSRDL
jgi:hypothetical protein